MSGLPSFSRPVHAAPVPDLGPTLVDATSRAGEAAFAIMRRNLARFLELLPVVRGGKDIEAVHDIRVAARRLRAAIGLFRDFLPARALTLRREMRWAARILGDVRDLDVQRGQLTEWIDHARVEEREALEALNALIAERRDAAHARLIRALDSRRFERLRDGFVEMVRRGPSRRDPSANIPLVVVAPDLVAKRYRAVRKAGAPVDQQTPEAELHELRVRCKRLRYALEFVQPVYPEPASILIRRLVRLQDVLGGIHDAAIAEGHLREMRTRAPRRLAPDVLFAMGLVSGRYERQADKLRSNVSGVYGRVTGKRWKEMKRAMERRRGAGRVPLPTRAKTLERPASAGPLSAPALVTPLVVVTPSQSLESAQPAPAPIEPPPAPVKAAAKPKRAESG